MDCKQTDKFLVDNSGDSQSANPESGPTPEVGWSLDKGVTRENNEDSLAAVTLNRASEAESQAIGVYAVADGMGGHQAGEVASQLAVRTAVWRLMGNVAESGDDMPENCRQWLEGAVALANSVVREQAQEKNTNMGTTLVMAVVVGHDVHIANVDDSRASLIPPSTMHQLKRDQAYTQA